MLCLHNVHIDEIFGRINTVFESLENLDSSAATRFPFCNTEKLKITSQKMGHAKLQNFDTHQLGPETKFLIMCRECCSDNSRTSSMHFVWWKRSQQEKTAGRPGTGPLRLNGPLLPSALATAQAQALHQVATVSEMKITALQ